MSGTVSRRLSVASREWPGSSRPCRGVRGDAIPPAMESESNAAKPRKTILRRVILFLVGGGVNYLLISTPFKYLTANTTLPVWGISACSIGVSTTFFFLWNYFVGFRTDSRKRDAFARYLVAVIVLWAMSSAL